MKMYRRFCGLSFCGLGGLAWNQLWRRALPGSDAERCPCPRHLWPRVLRHRVRLEGIPYCVPGCLERALHGALQMAGAEAAPTAGGRHRVPLGLLLLSRRQVSNEQLRAALAAQRASGQGRIGDWLRQMNFVGEPQITAALARQWSCPVLETPACPLIPVSPPIIPLLLLEAFRMIPFSYVAATATLHVAFADGIDYSILYAIERMLDCRTQPCVVSSSVLRESLLALGQRRCTAETVFERVSGISELVGIVCNYAVRAAAQQIRLARCPPYHWVRLECAAGQSVTLLLSIPPDPYAPRQSVHPYSE